MMKMRKEKGKKKQMQNTEAMRASVTFPPELYRTLEEIARKKKVSIAWVVRDAAEKYVEGQWPLFGKEEGRA